MTSQLVHFLDLNIAWRFQNKSGGLIFNGEKLKTHVVADNCDLMSVHDDIRFATTRDLRHGKDDRPGSDTHESELDIFDQQRLVHVECENLHLGKNQGSH